MPTSTIKFNVTVEVSHPDGTGISRADIVSRLLENIATSTEGGQHEDFEIIDIWATGLGKSEPLKKD